MHTSTPIKPYGNLTDIKSDEEREAFEVFRSSLRPTADQLARFNRPEFAELLVWSNTGVWRGRIKELPAEASGKLVVWYGDMRLNSGVSIRLPALAFISGEVGFGVGSKLDAPVLTAVGGDVDVASDAKFDAHALRFISGGVTLSRSVNFDTSAVVSIGGYVQINERAKFRAPSLTKIGGKIDIEKSGKLIAPKLLESRGKITVHDTAEFDPSPDFNY